MQEANSGSPVAFAAYYPQAGDATSNQQNLRSAPPLYAGPPGQHYSPLRGPPHTQHPHQPPYQARGRGRGGRGHFVPPSSSPISSPSNGRAQHPKASSPFLSMELKPTPVQPPATLAEIETPPAPRPQPRPATVTHLVSRTIRRATAPPLEVNIFFGPLGGFLEEHGSDVVLASSFKGAFRTANAPSSFCSAAQTCGIDVTALEYKDLLSADYNLHMLEPEQHCGALWLVELKQSTALSPFKPKDLIECYDMLKLHAREIIQEDTETLTMPLIGKGAKANHFQIGRSEVIVELVGFLHWIAENMSDRPNLSAINIVSSNNFTAQALQSAFDLLIPVQLDKLEEFLNRTLPRAAKVLGQFETELRKMEQSDKEEREEEKRLAKEENRNGSNDRPDWERRAAQREKRERRKKLDDIVTKLRIVRKSVENILAALHAFKTVQEVSIIIVACAVNGRIVAELCSELFLLEDGLLWPQQPPSAGAVGRGAGGRGRGQAIPFADSGSGRGRGRGRGDSTPFFAPPPATVPLPPAAMTVGPDQNLYGRMTQLKASGKIEKELYHHFQTLRLVGNKAVHSTVLKATTVDLGAIVLAVYGLIMSSHFAA